MVPYSLSDKNESHHAPLPFRRTRQDSRSPPAAPRVHSAVARCPCPASVDSVDGFLRAARHETVPARRLRSARDRYREAEVEFFSRLIAGAMCVYSWVNTRRDPASTRGLAAGLVQIFRRCFPHACKAKESGLPQPKRAFASPGGHLDCSTPMVRDATCQQRRTNEYRRPRICTLRPRVASQQAAP